MVENINIIKVSDISKTNVVRAYQITKDIDEDDMFFVALHLHCGHKIWTGDHALIKGLEAKGYDICITTAQLRKYLYKK